jgi:dihydroflavonol-4-reductase
MRPHRVLITGGAGFIGSHLVRQLVAVNHAVLVLEKPGAPVSHLPQDRIQMVFADIRDGAAVARAAGDCDVVVHLAANPNLWARNPDDFEQVNHQGTRHVLEAARRAGARRIVHVSTESILATACGQEMITEKTRTSLSDMIGPYCRSKWLAEQAAHEAVEAGQPVVIVRPTVPVGPGDVNLGPLSRLICDFCNGRVKGYLDGGLNLIDVRDAAAGIWAAAEHGEIGHRYLLAAEDWSVLGLLRLLAKLSGRPAPRWRVPYALALAFAYLEERVCSRLTEAVPMATVTGVRLTRRHFRFDGHQSVRELRLPPMRDCSAAVGQAMGWFRSAGFITT